MRLSLVTKPAATYKPDLSVQFTGLKRKLSSGQVKEGNSALPVSLAATGQGLVLQVNPTAYKNYTEDETFRIAGAEGLKHARKLGVQRLLIDLAGVEAPRHFAKIMTGLLLASYRYTDYQSKTPPKDPAITVVAGKHLAKFKALWREVQAIDAGVSTARDLANAPAADLVPRDLAAYARKMAKTEGLAFKQLTAAQLEQQGYVGITAVGQGSANPPVLFALIHQPAKVKKGVQPLCFVGKGVTFDSGGLCIKPGQDMWTMKADMHGAATVVGLMRAVARLKLPVPVIGVIGAAENMPDGKAYRPSDVLRYKNGLTVEIDNTDAEGRLVLADALLYSQDVLKQKRIVDFATLTGACVRALGNQYIGRMSKFPDFSAAVGKAGQAAGEPTWELPLHPEYRMLLDSPIADINHAGGPLAGAQTAGLFLHEFINEGSEFVHLDIAGTFLTRKKDKYWDQPGATGTGVRLAVELIKAAAG